MIKNGYGKIIDVNEDMHFALDLDGVLVTTTMTGNHPLSISNFGPRLKKYIQHGNFVMKLNGMRVYAEYDDDKLLYLELSGKDKIIT